MLYNFDMEHQTKSKPLLKSFLKETKCTGVTTVFCAICSPNPKDLDELEEEYTTISYNTVDYICDKYGYAKEEPLYTSDEFQNFVNNTNSKAIAIVNNTNVSYSTKSRVLKRCLIIPIKDEFEIYNLKLAESNMSSFIENLELLSDESKDKLRFIVDKFITGFNLNETREQISSYGLELPELSMSAEERIINLLSDKEMARELYKILSPNKD